MSAKPNTAKVTAGKLSCTCGCADIFTGEEACPGCGAQIQMAEAPTIAPQQATVTPHPAQGPLPVQALGGVDFYCPNCKQSFQAEAQETAQCSCGATLPE